MAEYNLTRGCGYPINTNSGCGCSANADYGCAAAANADCTAAAFSSDRSSNNGRSGDSDGCGCCKQSLREALKLLCCNAISDLVDFDAFAFLTDTNVVGATPTAMVATDFDNLGTLTGTFRRFSPCNCDMIDIAGTVVNPFGTTVEVDEASLCALSAIVFQLTPAPDTEPTSTCCPADTDLNRYRRVRDLLQNQLQSMSYPCGQCQCSCQCDDDCCCTAGVLSALSTAALNRRTTLAAGLLSLRNVTALGTLGTVLVLGSEETGRFYFVCANKVEFLA